MERKLKEKLLDEIAVTTGDLGQAHMKARSGSDNPNQILIYD